jgi:hypothetical protein
VVGEGAAVELQARAMSLNAVAGETDQPIRMKGGSLALENMFSQIS